MALAVIDQDWDAGFTSTSVITANAVIPVGALVVIGTGINSVGQTLNSIIDARGNSYNLQSVFDNSNPSQGFGITTAYAVVTTQIQIGDVITVVWSSGSAFTAMLAYTGGETSSPLDQQNQSLDDAFPPTDAAISGNISTTVADEILIGWNVCVNAGNTFSPTSGWTELFDQASAGSVLRYQLEYSIVSAIGTYSTNAAIADTTGNDYWSSRILSFKGLVVPPPEAGDAGPTLIRLIGNRQTW